MSDNSAFPLTFTDLKHGDRFIPRWNHPDTPEMVWIVIEPYDKGYCSDCPSGMDGINAESLAGDVAHFCPDEPVRRVEPA